HMHLKAIAALAAAAAFFAIHGAHAQEAATAGRCTSPWGAGDQIGAANRLTPEMARRAAGLVTTGKSYALSIETNDGTPAFGDRGIRIVVNQPDTIGDA